MPDENKRHVVDIGTKQKSWGLMPQLSAVLNKSKYSIPLLHSFVKVVIYISRPLPNKTKMKFDLDIDFSCLA